MTRVRVYIDLESGYRRLVTKLTTLSNIRPRCRPNKLKETAMYNGEALKNERVNLEFLNKLESKLVSVNLDQRVKEANKVYYIVGNRGT